MSRPGRIARRAGANLSRAARRLAGRAALPRAGGVWVVVRLGPFLEEVATPRLPIGPFGPQEEQLALLDVLEVLSAAADDPQVDGVLLRFSGTPGGWSRRASLCRAIAALRERKPVVAYADVLDGETLLVASAATKLWMPVSGSVFLVGLRVESLFLRGLLDRAGAQPEVVSVGRYKSAGERFTREGMSPEEREQVEFLVDDLFDELVEGIARGRGLESSRVRELVDGGPYQATAAVEAGLVDACLYPDQIEAELAELGVGAPGSDTVSEDGGEPGVPLVEGTTYHALRARDAGWRPIGAAMPRIAYVVGRGAIHRGGGSRGIASDTMRRLLERIRRDDETRGVVLRLDCPGGDGTASDLVWRSVSLLAKDKPVVVSMGDVVASGGYYVATAAHSVLAESSTLTGSIGVIGGKLNIGGLYERLGVHKEAIERGARAGMLSESRGFTADERATLRREMGSFYEVFLDRVAQGRGLSGDSLHGVAQGRIFSGTRALAVGLVDTLGGPLEALREVRRRAGIDDDERALLDIHPRLPRLGSLRPLLRWVPGRIVIP